MDPNAQYYFGMQRIANCFKLDLDELKNIDSLDELKPGYCVLCDEHEYAHAYKDKVLIAEGNLHGVDRFIMLRLFLDKYGTGKYELPELTKIRLVGQSEEEAIQWNRRAMEIMLRPLNIYEDLLARIDEAERELRWGIKNIESFNGVESEEDGCRALNGERPDYEDDSYNVIRPVSDGVWDVFYAVERGNGRLKFMLRIYGRNYLHEYILNNHLNAIG